MENCFENMVQDLWKNKPNGPQKDFTKKSAKTNKSKN